MVSMMDVVMVCQEAIYGIPSQHTGRIVRGILFGMSQSCIITGGQEDYFLDRLDDYGSVERALTNMYVNNVEWGV